MTIERTIQVATVADELVDAWGFVMTHLDDVGPDPRINISPIWIYGAEMDGEPPRKFDVSVSGTIEEADDE